MGPAHWDPKAILSFALPLVVLAFGYMGHGITGTGVFYGVKKVPTVFCITATGGPRSDFGPPTTKLEIRL